MKFKKMLTVLFTSVLLLTFSSPVGAVTGIGDTKESAVGLIPGTAYSLFLSDSNDEDWFKWTNTTGDYKFIGGYFSPSNKAAEYRLGIHIVYSPSRSSFILYANNYGPGNAQFIDNILIPPGATVYFKVDSINYAMMQYDFYFEVYNYNL